MADKIPEREKELGMPEYVKQEDGKVFYRRVGGSYRSEDGRYLLLSIPCSIGSMECPGYEADPEFKALRAQKSTA